MTSIPFEQARQDFDGLIKRVIADAEPIIVANPSGGSIVMMPLDEFASWQETAYLLSNPANATHLRRSLNELRGGRMTSRELDEE